MKAIKADKAEEINTMSNTVPSSGGGRATKCSSDKCRCSGVAFVQLGAPGDKEVLPVTPILLCQKHFDSVSAIQKKFNAPIAVVAEIEPGLKAVSHE